MGRGISEVRRNVFKAAAVAGIVILLVFAAGCSGDLLGYIQELVARAECKGIIDLPKTGQTSSHATGDDGALEIGVAWPVPRFTDNGNGTITDNLTGLIWLKDGNRFGSRTWAEALSDCNGLADDGTNLTDGSSAGDWRLPNRKELRSLINYGVDNNADWLYEQGIEGVLESEYWSSTTTADVANNAWVCYMVFGNVRDVIKSNATSIYVLAVRGGQAGGAVSLPRTGQTTCYDTSGVVIDGSGTGQDGDLQTGVVWPVPRFTDNINGTITDNLTGLMWERVLDGTTRTWTGALTYANGLDLGGHSDWRLPNVNELESLINAESANNHFWLFSQGFEGLDAGRYWSSTTYAPNSNDAWFVVLDRGNVHYDPKEINLYYVLAVRGGQ